MLEAEYFRSNYDIRSMLRLLFNADFFKNARFAKVKSPAETVVGTTRLVGDFAFPRPGFNALTLTIRYMGQDLLNPPTVEGWHTGREWIDSGTLVERINFTADYMGNINLPGVRDIIARLRAGGRHCRQNAWWTAVWSYWEATSWRQRHAVNWWRWPVVPGRSTLLRQTSRVGWLRCCSRS